MKRKNRWRFRGEEYWTSCPELTPEEEIEERLDELFSLPTPVLLEELIDCLGEAHIAEVLGWDYDVEAGLIQYFENKNEDVEDGVLGIFNGTPLEIIDRIVSILGERVVCNAVKNHQLSVELLLEGLRDDEY